MKPRVMVVEADSNQCLLYQMELEDEGYDVIVCRSVRETVSTARDACPDAVVFDLVGPDGAGLTVWQRLVEACGQCSVIVNSAYSHGVGRLAEIPEESYVLKSSDLSPLKKAVARAVNAASSAR